MTCDKRGGVVLITMPLKDLIPSLRLNPAYYDEEFLEVEHKLLQMKAEVLARFVPDKHPDGSKGITYGQVGSRKLSPNGTVRYLQVINVRDTGIG